MDEKKPSRREREKLSRRRQMLSAALDLFAEKGYHNISMHEIAKKAEFAIGTIYKFFRNKEDLYKSLMTEMASQYHHILADILSSDNDTLTVLGEYIAAKAEIFTDRISILRLYFAETRGASFNISAGLDRDMRKLYDELMEQLTLTMERGIRRNVLRKLDPYYMALSLEGLTNVFLFCWIENPDRHPYKENIPAILDLFLKGCSAE